MLSSSRLILSEGRSPKSKDMGTLLQSRLPLPPAAQAVDEIGKADLPVAAQPLHLEDVGDGSDAAREIVVDDDVVVFRPVAHLVARLGHARCDDRLAVLRPAAQPALE